MIIDYTISGSVPVGFSTAVASAVQYFENALTNNVTVNLSFTWAPLGSRVLAQTSLADNSSQVDYAAWRAAMLASAQGSGGTADNLIAANGLPATDPFGNGRVLVPYPVASAIGLQIPGVTSDPVSTDATITLNSSEAFAFDPNNRSVSGNFDALGTLEHEISEALGRIAGSDGNSNQTGDTSPTLDIGLPLDFFRYNNADNIDITSNYSGEYFSLNGGINRLIAMGESNSDLADWGSSVQGDAAGYGSAGQEELFTAVDLQAMSAIGWHVASNTELYATVFLDIFHATGAAVHVLRTGSGATISGDNNVVDIASEVGWTISATVLGNGNTLRILGGGDVATISGSSNSVSTEAAGATVTIGGNGQNSGNLDSVNFLSGGTAFISDNSSVTLRGAIGTAVVGNNDTVTINTGSGSLGFNGTNSVVTLAGSSQVYFHAGGNTLTLIDGVTATLNTLGETIHAGSNDNLTINSTSASVDQVTITGTNTHLTINGNEPDNPELVTFQAGGRLSIGTAYSSSVDASGDGISADLSNFATLVLHGGRAAVNVAGHSSEVRIGGNGSLAAVSDVVSFAQGGTVTVSDGSRVAVDGSNVTMNVGNSDNVGITGSNEVVNVTGTGSAVWIGSNGQYTSAIDNITFAGGGTANILDYSRVNVTGSGEGVNVGNYDSVGAIGSSETVNVNGTGSAVWIGSNGQYTSAIDSITFAGGGTANILDYSRVNVTGSGEVVNVGNYDSVGAIGSSEVVNVTGTGSAVWIGSNGQAASTADAINFASAGTAYVLANSKVSVAGNSVSVNLSAADAVALLGQSDTVTLSGTDTLSFAPAIGHAIVSGFDSSDQIALSMASFGAQANGFDYWAHLLNDASVTGGNTTITLDDSDSIVLENFILTAANQSQFHFF